MSRLITCVSVLALFVASTNADEFILPVNQSIGPDPETISGQFDFPPNSSGQIDFIESISIDITHTFAADISFSVTVFRYSNILYFPIKTRDYLPHII